MIMDPSASILLVIIMHKTGPFTNSGVSKFVKLVVVYTKHQQLNNTKNYLIQRSLKVYMHARLFAQWTRFNIKFTYMHVYTYIYVLIYTYFMH